MIYKDRIITRTVNEADYPPLRIEFYDNYLGLEHWGEQAVSYIFNLDGEFDEWLWISEPNDDGSEYGWWLIHPFFSPARSRRGKQ